MLRRVPPFRRAAKLLWRLAKDPRGVSAIEYGLIIAVIVLIWLIAFTLFADVAVGMWHDIGKRVTEAR